MFLLAMNLVNTSPSRKFKLENLNLANVLDKKPAYFQFNRLIYQDVRMKTQFYLVNKLFVSVFKEKCLFLLQSLYLLSPLIDYILSLIDYLLLIIGRTLDYCFLSIVQYF